jgi:hypothetical protein
MNAASSPARATPLVLTRRQVEGVLELVDVLLDAAEALEEGAAELTLEPASSALRMTASLARQVAGELAMGVGGEGGRPAGRSDRPVRRWGHLAQRGVNG